MLFEKMLRLPIYSDEDFGKLINMATSDVDIIEWGALFNAAPGIPAAILLSFFFLIPIMGWISVITIVLCWLFILIGLTTSPIIVRLRNEIAAKADLRGSTLSNIIEGIRVIKISTLERIFIEEMAEKRADEI
jgi:ABC-type multidrug transport system fused ATPase/permease subunit